MKNTYLCGGINKLPDAECKNWREEAKRILRTKSIDPMRRDYRGVEDQNYNQIVIEDLKDIKFADFILVNATKPSWGTAMEIVYAYQMGKTIAAFTDGNPSPWLRYHCNCFNSIKEAIEYINSQVNP